MTLSLFFMYLATWSLVALTPGPAVMCAMSHATRYGFRPSLIGIIGIQLGHLVFFGCVAFGLTALLATASTAFTILRLLGALYLFYLGIRIIASTFRPTITKQTISKPPARSSLLFQGFAIQVTNPKALLFMSALLPQFIQPQHSLSLQLSVFLLTTIIVDILVLSSYAYIARRGVQLFRTSWLERIFGAALILFGFRLLAARR
jgi:homoserine/homoserine lactone efflux protein